MAVIAKWGGRVFEVSPKKKLTFSNYSRKASYKTSTKDRSGKKPYVKREGPDLGSVSFDVVIDAGLGLKPQANVDKWVALCESGKTDYLILGGKRHGKLKWTLTGVNISDAEYMNKGQLLHAKVGLTFTEFTQKPPKKGKK